LSGFDADRTEALYFRLVNRNSWEFEWIFVAFLTGFFRINGFNPDNPGVKALLRVGLGRASLTLPMSKDTGILAQP